MFDGWAQIVGPWALLAALSLAAIFFPLVLLPVLLTLAAGAVARGAVPVVAPVTAGARRGSPFQHGLRGPPHA
jgi:hypothetical protein